MRESLRRVGAVAAKEFVHLKRDELSMGMIFGIPLIMTLLFGYAINQDVRHLAAGVVDESGSSESRALLAGIQATRVVDIRERFDSTREMHRALEAGRISVGIFVPADYEQRLRRGDSGLRRPG